MAKDKRRGRSSLSFGEKMLFLAGILLCLVLITTALLGGLFARYVTTDTGDDTARVASFGQLTLEEDGDFAGKKGMIIPGVDLKKEVKISFSGSEMATYIFVEVVAPGWQNTGKSYFYGTCMAWSVEEQWIPLQGYPGVYYLEVKTNTAVNGENFIKPLDPDGQTHIRVSADITKEMMKTLADTDFTIKLQASVIQSGGFENAAAAWDYLSPG